MAAIFSASQAVGNSPAVMLALERLQDLRGPCIDSANAELDLAASRLVLAIAAQRDALRQGNSVSLPLVNVSLRAFRSAVATSRQVAESGLSAEFDVQLNPLRKDLDDAVKALDGSWKGATEADHKSYVSEGFMPQSEFLVHHVRSSTSHLQQAVAQCRDFDTDRDVVASSVARDVQRSTALSLS